MVTIKNLWNLAENNRAKYLMALVCTLGTVMCALVAPQIIKITVDSVLGDEPLNTYQILEDLITRVGGVEELRSKLYLCGLALIVITLVEVGFQIFKGKFLAQTSENIALRMKDELFDRLQNVAYDYHVKAQTGDLIQRCTSDVETVRKFLASQLADVVRIIFLAAASLSVMFSLHIQLTLIAMISFPFLFVFSIVFFIAMKKAFLDADQKEGMMSTVLQENLSGVRVVRAFGRQKFETEKFEEKNSSLRDSVDKVIHYLAIYWSASHTICVLQTLAVLIFAVKYCVAGEITLGTLLLFTSYIGMLVWPMRDLGRILSDMGKTQVALGRIYEILDTPNESDTEGAIESNLAGDIEFKNVSFEYEKNKEILKNISFKVKRGQTIAVLGSTGSGKSTLMHILLRLYDYKSGSVLIDGVELRNIKKSYLRKKIGLVLQEPFLFSKTIKDNIKMAKYKATDKEIFQSAETASVHDVIESFEKGYETIVGEKGVTLSGGQKQRVAIARTIIKESDILIFDDSLSAVDTETDAQIREALSQTGRGVTTFIISQRITTLKDADQIIVMEGGKITDIGTHDELVNREGLYARIWQIQNMLEDDFIEGEVTSS